jgi:hypothetical protein
MATKTEIIKKLNDACTRVLKQSDFAGGVVTALTLVVTRLSALRDQIATAGEIDPNISIDMWDELYECGKVLDSVYYGFPMVPAEDVATLATDDAGEDMGADEMVEMCATTLEKAAVAKGMDAGPMVATVKVALATWSATGETDVEGAKVRVFRCATLAKLAKACGDKKMKAKDEAVAAEKDKAAEEAKKAAAMPDEKITKIDSIAKAADPAPVAPAPFAWPNDMNRR